mmetsp:Transcript_19094/g.37935  ORF Transcript_19094/g.37935 Transcript_19094/m.37935 type:complete len:121 (+) Transcript_19094:393-755(+)
MCGLAVAHCSSVFSRHSTTKEHRWRGVTQDRGVVCSLDAYFCGNRKAGRWCTAVSVPPHHARGRPGSDRFAVLRAIKKPWICVWELTERTHCPLLHGRVRPSQPPHAVFFRDPRRNNSNK